MQRPGLLIGVFFLATILVELVVAGLRPDLRRLENCYYQKINPKEIQNG